MTRKMFSQTVLACAALVCTSSVLGAAFPHTPESRTVPAVGTSQSDLLASFGRPTRGIVTQQIGASNVHVWDFGTFRVYLKDGHVVESRRW